MLVSGLFKAYRTVCGSLAQACHYRQTQSWSRQKEESTKEASPASARSELVQSGSVQEE